jgi:hypothetical protein
VRGVLGEADRLGHTVVGSAGEAFGDLAGLDFRAAPERVEGAGDQADGVVRLGGPAPGCLVPNSSGPAITFPACRRRFRPLCSRPGVTRTSPGPRTCGGLSHTPRSRLLSGARRTPCRRGGNCRVDVCPAPVPMPLGHPLVPGLPFPVSWATTTCGADRFVTGSRTHASQLAMSARELGWSGGSRAYGYSGAAAARTASVVLAGIGQLRRGAAAAVGTAGRHRGAHAAPAWWDEAAPGRHGRGRPARHRPHHR